MSHRPPAFRTDASFSRPALDGWSAADGPAPDAAWVTVCFRPPEPRTGPLRAEDTAASVFWRSRATHGPALVRSRALPTRETDGAPPYDAPSACLHPPGRRPCDVHLWADPDTPGPSSLAEHADVLVSRAPLPPAAARRRVRDLLGGHPGCLAAGVPGSTEGCFVAVRDATGGMWCARLDHGPTGASVALQVVVSVVHAWTATGGSPGELRAVAPLPGR